MPEEEKSDSVLPSLGSVSSMTEGAEPPELPGPSQKSDQPEAEDVRGGGGVTLFLLDRLSAARPDLGMYPNMEGWAGLDRTREPGSLPGAVSFLAHHLLPLAGRMTLEEKVGSLPELVWLN